MRRRGLALTAVLAMMAAPSVARGQTVSTPAPQGAKPPSPAATPPPASETVDVMDLLRKWRGKELTAEQRAAALDPQARMRAAAPIIGYKPSSGVLIGVAGNLAFFRGDPATTNISSNVASFTFSSKKQISLMARSHVFGGDNRWALDGDHRAQWTSLDTYGLGTSTTTESAVNLEFDYFRVYDTAYVQVRRNLHAGLGFHLSTHTSIGPGDDADEAWDTSPFVTYSEANGFPLDSQTSAGTSLNLRFDSRDSGINPGRGWLASVNYRPFFKGFLGGDSSWQELYLDVRTYRALDATGRHKLAFWMWGDAVAGGVAPYLDLPATGTDKYGRSARGYAEGRFRGERLLYGEVEYRGTLTRNGLLGMVAFLNTTTLENSGTGEQLFDGFSTGAGAGLRLLLNKRSRTNLCFDVGIGKQGSRGLYLSVEEVF